MFEGLQEDQLKGAVEAMLFVTDEPVGTITLAEMLECDVALVEAALVELRADLEARGSGIQLREVAGGWRLFTHPAYHELIEKYVLSWDTRKLSGAAMETLAIVAYLQPVTRASLASVRGVNSDSPLNSLVEKGLVREVGTADTPGNPTLYGTTRGFLEKFGLRSPADLPDLADFAPDEETRRLITERLSASRQDVGVTDEQAQLMAGALMEADLADHDGEALLFDEEAYVGLDAAAASLAEAVAQERAAAEAEALDGEESMGDASSQTQVEDDPAEAAERQRKEEALFAQAIASTLGVVDKIDFDSLTFETDDE
ncbi:SMC-Scp complex subunit ScpB [Adlercreutzia equolifaciens]|uniref:SMC-Scp complex subunit ScpB n=1 Tax=Adlercreutzia equolifaciens TaxID=446660 RepID=UPI0023AE787A|nr:SMC-Scp complex subunit ScpB [Adlercreutzia equolifaciens]MDE8702957.1 SMC-Scp complex subunit ScpB [Adlercreutzia equolifaciens]